MSVLKNTGSEYKTGRRVIHAGVMILLMLGLQILGAVIVSLIKIGNDPALESSINAALVDGNKAPFNDLLTSCTIPGTLLGGLIALLPYILKDVTMKNYCIAWISPWTIPALLSAGVVLNTVATLIINAFPDEGASITAEMITQTEPWIALLSIGVVTPIVEEMYFRRAIINAIRDRNKPIAVVASAAVFAALHTGEVQMAYAFVFGIMFAVIYVKTGNIIYSALLHIAINTSSALVIIGGENSDQFAIPVISVCAVITLVAGIVVFVKTRRKA